MINKNVRFSPGRKQSPYISGTFPGLFTLQGTYLGTQLSTAAVVLTIAKFPLASVSFVAYTDGFGSQSFAGIR